MHRSRIASIFACLSLGICLQGFAQAPPRGPGYFSRPIHGNPNTRAAGRMVGGVRVLDLEVRGGSWHPLAEDGPSLPIYAFAEAGAPLTTPGPLIRVAANTRVRVTVRNRLDSTVVVHGLHTRPGPDSHPLVIAPGESARVEFSVGAAGTYFYWANTSGLDLPFRYHADSQLNGALVVDPPGAMPDDRVFVLSTWTTLPDPAGLNHPAREQNAINGKAWPNLERLTLRQDQPVRWRWINASRFAHPMHLHGFYFDLLGRGDGLADTLYAPGQPRRAVTEVMVPGETALLRFTPTRPGYWLFHCHFSNHVTDLLGADGAAPAHHPGGMEGMGGMSGLVLGLQVTPRQGAAAPAPLASAPRRMRLLVHERAGRGGAPSTMSYLVQDGAEPARDSMAYPSMPLLLRQGEPVAITVVNRTSQPTAVHWHGLEIESFPDGVPGWSGSGGNLMPMIAPGDSFVARFTPPRAGTFIYHTHLSEVAQMIAGLYAALVVLPPGERWDPEHDLVVLAGAGPPPAGHTRASGMVNGSTTPAALHLRQGDSYRIRVVSINSEWRVRFALMRDSTLQRWRPLARDGADLAEWERAERPASIVAGAGETVDFAWTPRESGSYRLDVVSQRPGWRIQLPLEVSAAVAAR